jgi:DNA-binding CsgD family transcriptional regulator
MQERDAQLLALISRGYSTLEAAETMGEKPHQAYDRLRRTRRELGVRTTIEAMVAAIRRGLI